MKYYLVSFAIFTTLVCGCQKNETSADRAINVAPEMMIGRFIDDYDIEYTISDTSWLMDPDTRFNILQWNTEEQFVLAQNHPENDTDAGLFSRIDYMIFDKNMEPYQWGFCISTYDAESLAAAKSVTIADRENPKTGCNGHPFSRMKRIDDKSGD